MAATNSDGLSADGSCHSESSEEDTTIEKQTCALATPSSPSHRGGSAQSEELQPSPYGTRATYPSALESFVLGRTAALELGFEASPASLGSVTDDHVSLTATSDDVGGVFGARGRWSNGDGEPPINQNEEEDNRTCSIQHDQAIGSTGQSAPCSTFSSVTSQCNPSGDESFSCYHLTMQPNSSAQVTANVQSPAASSRSQQASWISDPTNEAVEASEPKVSLQEMSEQQETISPNEQAPHPEPWHLENKTSSDAMAVDNSETRDESTDAANAGMDYATSQEPPALLSQSTATTIILIPSMTQTTGTAIRSVAINAAPAYSSHVVESNVVESSFPVAAGYSVAVPVSAMPSSDASASDASSASPSEGAFGLLPETPSSSSNRKKRSMLNDASSSASTGRWTDSEHSAFLSGLQTYGREWKKVASHIPTRTSAQVRSHAQKYFAKVQREAEHQDQGAQTSFSQSSTQGGLWASSVPDSASASSSAAMSLSAWDDSSLPASVQAQARRIVEFPETVQQEVDDTLHQLRERYRQLQEQLQRQLQVQHDETAELETVDDLEIDDEGDASFEERRQLDAADVGEDSPMHVEASEKHKDEARGTELVGSSSSSAMEVIYLPSNEEELIAVHVLRGGLPFFSAMSGSEANVERNERTNRPDADGPPVQPAAADDEDNGNEHDDGAVRRPNDHMEKSSDEMQEKE